MEEICKVYCEANATTDNPLSWGAFYKFYTDQFDAIQKLRHKSDFCDSCCKFNLILISKNSTPEVKQEAQENKTEHLNKVERARKAYNTYRLHTALQNDKFVLSFDYAENILLPSLVETPGIFYFKTRRKLDLFGIINEGTKMQANFIIDEGFKISKGPDSVISMLHYYLMKNIPKDSSIILYSDNCAGQNKNQTVIGYLSYLVKVLKYFKEIELNFMISGHTKFSPDGHFGRIKSSIKETNCFSILDLIGEEGKVKKSAYSNYEIVYKDPLTSTINFHWRNWKKFLKDKFLPCVGIRDWHVVKIMQDTNNILVANYVDEPFRSFKIMNSLPAEGGEPDILIPEDISESRLKDLEFFADYVTEDHKPFILKKY